MSKHLDTICVLKCGRKKNIKMKLIKKDFLFDLNFPRLFCCLFYFSSHDVYFFPNERNNFSYTYEKKTLARVSKWCFNLFMSKHECEFFTNHRLAVYVLDWNRNAFLFTFFQRITHILNSGLFVRVFSNGC